MYLRARREGKKKLFEVKKQLFDINDEFRFLENLNLGERVGVEEESERRLEVLLVCDFIERERS
jgi:hypothetical protein